MRWCNSFQIGKLNLDPVSHDGTGRAAVQNVVDLGAVDDQCIGKPRPRKKKWRPAPLVWRPQASPIRSDQAGRLLPLAGQCIGEAPAHEPLLRQRKCVERTTGRNARRRRGTAAPGRSREGNAGALLLVHRLAGAPDSAPPLSLVRADCRLASCQLIARAG